jgi:hypothetical protein
MADRVYDPRTSLNLARHCPRVDDQCADTERGYFCTARAGHDSWHVAYGRRPAEGSLHIWYRDPGQPNPPGD